MDAKITELRVQFPSATAGLTLRGNDAVAVRLDANEEVPFSACQASRPMIAVYGLQAAPADKNGIWFLGSIGIDDLERHPRARGLVIRYVQDLPGTRLTAAQVERLRELASGELSLRAVIRSRPSGFSDVSPNQLALRLGGRTPVGV